MIWHLAYAGIQPSPLTLKTTIQAHPSVTCQIHGTQKSRNMSLLTSFCSLYSTKMILESILVTLLMLGETKYFLGWLNESDWVEGWVNQVP